MYKYIYDEAFDKQHYTLTKIDDTNKGRCPVCNEGFLDLERHPVLNDDIPLDFNIGCKHCGRFFKR